MGYQAPDYDAGDRPDDPGYDPHQSMLDVRIHSHFEISPGKKPNSGQTHGEATMSRFEQFAGRLRPAATKTNE
jgi:hypothetical protein